MLFTNELFRDATLFIKPLWGIGNRLRTIRKAYDLCDLLHRRLIIVDHRDEGFNVFMEHLFGVPVTHISNALFKSIYSYRCHDLKYNKQCTYVGTLDECKAVPKNKPIYIEACDIELNEINNANKLYTLWKPMISPKAQQNLNKIKSNRSNVIGVHIRQGNVNDWHRGYFYGDEWNNISTKEPESSPHFCCFEDASKNLSACPSNIQHIEQYVTKMRTYPQTTSFFVCSDRIGCLVYLHQIFPNRIIMNEAIIEGKDVDTKRGFDDFICLGACSEIITSKVSSFSDEAKIIRNIKISTL